MLAPWIPGHAVVPSSVSNLSPPRLFGWTREPDQWAEDALGDTRLLAPETEGKPGLTHPHRASPRARPGPRMWGAGTGTAPERPEPRPGSRVQPGRVPPPPAASGAAATLARARSRAAAPQTPGRDKAPERAPPSCSSSSCGPRRPLPVSLHSRISFQTGALGWVGLFPSPPLSQVSTTFLL